MSFGEKSRDLEEIHERYPRKLASDKKVFSHVHGGDRFFIIRVVEDPTISGGPSHSISNLIQNSSRGVVFHFLEPIPTSA